MSNKAKELNKKISSLQFSVDQLNGIAKKTKSMTYAIHDEVCYIDELCAAIRDMDNQIQKLSVKVDLLYKSGRYKYSFPPSQDEITEEMLKIAYNDPDLQF